MIPAGSERDKGIKDKIDKLVFEHTGHTMSDLISDNLLDLIHSEGYINLHSPVCFESEGFCDNCDGTGRSTYCSFPEISMHCDKGPCTKCDIGCGNCKGTGKCTIKQYAFVKCEDCGGSGMDNGNSEQIMPADYTHTENTGLASTPSIKFTPYCPTCSGSGYRKLSYAEWLKVEWEIKWDKVEYNPPYRTDGAKPYYKGQLVELRGEE